MSPQASKGHGAAGEVSGRSPGDAFRVKREPVGRVCRACGVRTSSLVAGRRPGISETAPHVPPAGHRGTRTTPSWITETARRPSCV